MTDATKDSTNQLEINAQYIKDLSFESPRAPLSLTTTKNPHIELSVDVTIQSLHATSYEVALHVTAKAMEEKEPVFLVDVIYAGLFTVPAIEDEAQRDMVLFVYCPNLLFPFARRVIAETTRDGGFPALMINPIDFMALYHQRRQQDTAMPKGDA